MQEKMLRPLPPNFLAVYEECEGRLSYITKHYRTNDNVVSRWLAEVGLTPAHRQQSSRYKRLTHVSPGDLTGARANAILRRVTAGLRGETVD